MRNNITYMSNDVRTNVRKPLKKYVQYIKSFYKVIIHSNMYFIFSLVTKDVFFCESLILNGSLLFEKVNILTRKLVNKFA